MVLMPDVHIQFTKVRMIGTLILVYLTTSCAQDGFVHIRLRELAKKAGSNSQWLQLAVLDSGKVRSMFISHDICIDNFL